MLLDYCKRCKCPLRIEPKTTPEVTPRKIVDLAYTLAHELLTKFVNSSLNILSDALLFCYVCTSQPTIRQPQNPLIMHVVKLIETTLKEKPYLDVASTLRILRIAHCNIVREYYCIFKIVDCKDL